MPREIGIYGGTFSPPHVGHVHAALAFLRTLGLDMLYVIPAAIPPHKRVSGSDDPHQRLEMLQLAFGDCPEYGKRLLISDFELSCGGKSYTVNTLEHFNSLYPRPENRLTLLCGSDMFVTLDSWRMPERIFELARVAFIQRGASAGNSDLRTGEYASLYRNKYNADIVEVNSEIIDLSSSGIRVDIASGENADSALPPAVAEYIREKHLYLG